MMASTEVRTYLWIMSSNDQLQDQERHDHCDGCHRINCPIRPRSTFSCKMMSCTLGCGHRFHGCKLTEHLQLCPNRKVACINQEYGCPLFMARKDCGIHLETCPASVIHCPMEWNRWPVYSQERQMRVPFVQEKLHAKFGQLDVALALRDQRILNEGFKAPRSTRRVLRNNLTLRFPAVPLKSPRSSGGSKDTHQTESTMSDDDADTPWGLAKNPPGLQRSVCNELFKATQTMAESLTTALRMTTGAAQDAHSLEGADSHGAEGYDSLVNGCKTEDISHVNGDDNCAEGGASCEDLNGHTGGSEQAQHLDYQDNSDMGYSDIGATNGVIIEEPDTTERNPPIPPILPPTLKEILALDLTIERISRYQAKPKSMYTFLCASEFRRDEYPWHFLNVHNDIHSGLNGWLEQRCPLSNSGCTFSLRRLYPNSKGGAVVYSSAVEAFGVRPHIPEYHLRVGDISNLISDEPSKQTCDSPMDDSARDTTPEIYTSRDYDSFVQVKGDFKCLNKVNGVTRIPCDIDADSQGQDQTNNCVNSEKDICDDNTMPDTFSILPFEVLQHVARFLDGFSLCNLALTSKLLRDVCCSLLEEKGIVTQEWQKKKVGDRNHWFVGYKRWTFSLAFDPVTEWGYEDNIHMSEHLKTCPFFHRVRKTEPFFFPELGSKGALLRRVFSY